MKILIVNGPNLNMLGIREPGIYGSLSLSTVEDLLNKTASDLGIEIDFFQSNHEGEIVDKIQSAIDIFDGLIINAAAYTHTSIAIRDAIKAVNLPMVEVHISNIFSREEFRKVSYLSDIAIGVISGLGIKGYEFALKFLVDYLS